MWVIYKHRGTEMKKLRELREAATLTQERFAEILNISIDTLKKWEAGMEEPAVKALRDIAVYFGTGIDDLLGMASEGTPITTTNPCRLVPKGHDGFWGHLGLMLPGEAKSHWYPITRGQYEELSERLADGDKGWVASPTLNNRFVMFDKLALKKICLMDDDSDQCGNDRDLPWDGYNGYSPEIYKALEMFVWRAMDDEELDEEYSKPLQSVVTDLMAEHQFDESHLIDTHFHCMDGSSLGFSIELRWLDEIAKATGGGLDGVITFLDSDGFRLHYFPVSQVRLIDMPLVKVLEGRKERAPKANS
jgi:transcriptional regulator with XRE-family HTH domain